MFGLAVARPYCQAAVSLPSGGIRRQALADIRPPSKYSQKTAMAATCSATADAISIREGLTSTINGCTALHHVVEYGLDFDVGIVHIQHHIVDFDIEKRPESL